MVDRRRFFLAPFLARAMAAQQSAEKLAPYVPTPQKVVVKMLEFGGLKAGEKMFDLGSGDGRIVITAAQQFGADATGVELDTDLYRQSTDKIRKLRLTPKARIIHGDILQQDYSSADLVTVYLFPGSNEKVRPMLERQLRKGARVVAHDFEFGEWKPARTLDIEEDGEGQSRRLYLYLR